MKETTYRTNAGTLHAAGEDGALTVWYEHRPEVTLERLPISRSQIENWRAGTYAQHAFRELNEDQREFLISGVTGEEFDALFPPDDEDDEDEPPF